MMERAKVTNRSWKLQQHMKKKVNNNKTLVMLSVNADKVVQ
jgi:hypothetical protein